MKDTKEDMKRRPQIKIGKDAEEEINLNFKISNWLWFGAMFSLAIQNAVMPAIGCTFSLGKYVLLSSGVRIIGV